MNVEEPRSSSKNPNFGGQIFKTANLKLLKYYGNKTKISELNQSYITLRNTSINDSIFNMIKIWTTHKCEYCTEPQA